jgi:hypothetical protein
MVPGVPYAYPGFLARLWLALVCLVRVITDRALARSIGELLAGSTSSERAPVAELPAPPPPAPVDGGPDHGGALALLALFQREGRLIDFLEQEIATFPDAEIGAAARLVHEGCRRALHAHATVAPIRSETEESRIVVEDGYPRAAIKLTGNVGSKPPYRGTLRHAGWRVTDVRLPTALADHDPEVVAPAEVEL